MKKIAAKVWKFLRLPKLVQLFIMRFVQDQFLIGVSGVIFNDKDEVLLFKHTYRQREWSLPGGYMTAREHPGEGLEREIEEESQLVVSADEQLYIKTDRESARLELCFMGTFIGGRFKSSKEVSEYGFFSFDKLPDISRRQLFVIKQALDLREQRRMETTKQVQVSDKNSTQTSSALKKNSKKNNKENFFKRLFRFG